ncbi:MAG: HAMP domain-containing histidine kinase [Chitinophagaceae bacterium]|nr:HAMP domain-containing histidine kinase [Chitinophagaceae bacterium]
MNILTLHLPAFLCKKRRLILFSLITALFVFSKDIYGQPERKWVLKTKLDANEGTLPQNSVIDLFFDNETGFLWCATEAGLVRYNGKTAYNFDSRNTNALQTPRFRTFYKNLTDKIVVVSSSGEGFFIDADTIHFAGRHNAFLGSKFGKAFCNYNDSPGNLSDARPSAAASKQVPESGADPLQAYWTGYNEYIACSNDGIFYIRNKEVKGVYIKKGFGASSLFFLGKQLYARTVNGDTYIVNTSPFSVIPAATDAVIANTKGVLFPNIVTGKPLLLLENTLYTVTASNGRIVTQLLAILPFKVPGLSSIIVHPNGHYIYCGSFTLGLYVFSRPNFFTYIIPQGSVPQSDLEARNIPGRYSNNIYSVVLLHDSTQALTSDNVLFDLEKGTFRYPGSNNVNPLNNYTVSSNSFLWGFGATVSYITRHTAGQNKKTTLINNNKAPNYFSRTSDGKIWALYSDGLGLFENDSIRMIKRPLDLPDSIAGNQLSDLTNPVIGYLDNKTLLLFWRHYLYTLDTASMAFTKYADLPPYQYRSFIKENERYYWICTYGNGILLFDVKERKVFPVPTDHGNYLLYAHTLAPDGNGNLLIPTNKGLFRIRKQHLLNICLHGGQPLYEYYDTRQGLINVEFNGGCMPAFNRLPGNDILFPSIDGLVRVFTSGFQSPVKYPIFIESIKSANRSRLYKKNIAFNPNERTQIWTINYARWSDVYAGNIFYRLDNGEWQSAETPAITLSELDGGKHTLEIKIQFDLEGTQISTTTFSFYVGKRYYEQLWFWIVLLAGMTGLIILISYLRNYRIKQANIQLAKKVEERTTQLEAKKEQLTHKNKELEKTLDELKSVMTLLEGRNDFQKKMIRIIGHDVMIPLKYIAKTARQLSKYKAEISTDLRNETVEEINTTSTSLTYLGQSIIQWIKMQEIAFKLTITSFNVLSELHEIIPLHEKILSEKNNRLKLMIQPGLSVTYDATALRIIIHNLVMNANKFTENGVISIKCAEENKKIILAVADTGIGMHPDIRDKLNQLIAVSPLFAGNSDSGWGLGYNVIIELINISKGTLNIISAPGEGTKVNIIIPE